MYGDQLLLSSFEEFQKPSDSGEEWAPLQIWFWLGV